MGSLQVETRSRRGAHALDRVRASVLQSARDAHARALRETRRSAVVIAAHRLSTEEQAMLTRCAWCDRVELGEQWLKREDAPLLPAGIGGRTTHGICPLCVNSLRRTGRSR